MSKSASHSEMLVLASALTLMTALLWLLGPQAGLGSTNAGPAFAPLIVSVNRGQVAELAVLPGLTKHSAELLVQLREKHGSFESFEQLLKHWPEDREALKRARPFLDFAGASGRHK